jgi:hypothetical protein
VIRTIRPPGELLLDRVTRAERQGDELPDEPCADGESIEPRLAGDDDVILRLAGQLRGPRCTGDDVNLSRRALHCARIPRRKADPERFALIHGQNAPAALEPGGRGRRGKVVQGTERERAEVEGLAHEEEPDSGELGVLVIRLLSDPRMAGQQSYRGFDRIGEALRQSDVFPVRIVVRLQRDVGE